MDLKTLADNFRILLDAPGAVASLRRLILQLAATGRLRSADSSELGNRVTLADVGSWAIGSGFPKKLQGETGQEILFCKVSDMNLPGNEVNIARTVHSISRETASSNGIKVHPPGTVVFPKIGGAIATNKRRILVLPTAIDNNCLGIVPSQDCSTEWLYLILRSIDFSEYQVGTSVPALSQGTLGKIAIELPSKEEQHRIVAKVDQLMQLCDELEQKQEKVTLTRNKLNAVSLEKLVAARNAEEFEESWGRVRENFDLLVSHEEDLHRVSQCTLSLAMMGHLSRHLEFPGTGLELLMSVAAKRQVEFEIRAATSSHHPVPYILPENWCWARFDHVAEIASNLVKPDKYGDFPHIGPDCIEKYTGRLNSYRTVREDKVVSAKHHFFPGQILYSKIRPNLVKAILVDFEGLCSADMYPLNSLINVHFLLLYILSPVFTGMAVRKDTRVAMPKINQVDLKEILVPVPSLAEQEAIVGRVQAIFRLCNELKLRRLGVDTAEAKYGDAILANLLRIEPSIRPENTLYDIEACNAG